MNDKFNIAKFYEGKEIFHIDNYEFSNLKDLIIRRRDKYQDSVALFCDSFSAGSPITEMCKAIFDYLVANINYIPDGQEQKVKSPGRLFHDKQGDAKSYSVFIANCLEYLKIKYVFRFASYNNTDIYTNVYIVAIDENGKPIIMDVTSGIFNNEIPTGNRLDV